MHTNFTPLEVFMRFVVVQLDRKKVSPRTGGTHPWQPVSGLPKD